MEVEQNVIGVVTEFMICVMKREKHYRDIRTKRMKKIKSNYNLAALTDVLARVLYTEDTLRITATGKVVYVVTFVLGMLLAISMRR